MEKENEKLKMSYAPIIIDREVVELPVMEFSGKSDKKYLVLPDEYFNVEEHVLLNGVTLIPIQNKFIE